MDSLLARIFAGVLTLFAVGGVVLYMAGANESSKVSQTTQDIAVLSTNVRSQFMQSSTGYMNFNSGNQGILVTAGNIFPADMVKSGNVVDAWGNPVSYSPVAGNLQFSISIGGANLGTSACSKLATSLNGYNQMIVGGTTFTPSTPADGVSAAAACSSGTNITLTYQ